LVDLNIHLLFVAGVENNIFVFVGDVAVLPHRVVTISSGAEGFQFGGGGAS
jgi:hypothetical protein